MAGFSQRLSQNTLTLGCAVVLLAGCAAPQPAPVGAPTSTSSPATTAPTTSTTTTPKPLWRVGAQPLPKRADGFGAVLPTPPELVNRALPTTDVLPPPTGTRFASAVSAVPADVLARSTWQPGCPVRKEDLRYLTLSFWGFDGRQHTGELLVNASAADAMVAVFGTLWAARFPLEEMRISSRADLDRAPTGDGNNTSAFVCRPARGSSTWSAHAHGIAVDINPFCNPYLRGDLVLPELAGAYVNRSRRSPGMIFSGDVVTRAFASVGWTWGGSWRSPKDLMHFSANGR
ncbi:M15 family metallopeptidase [Allokutzneria albata]|uniref:M15 family metallopeptidase n=1 Tax=Allokutzneria albata TaxID=211114 RepID=UPI001E47539F|nr:M15 family metallopeptidase [Allokutzneria albata]